MTTITPLPEKPQYVYVASSWANPMQTAVCAALRSMGIDHYDFKNPGDGRPAGFHWSEVMPSYNPGRRGPGQSEQLAEAREYIEALKHPAADAGYSADYDAMCIADTFILVLPCGRSAHLELGWAVGAHTFGKNAVNTAILLDADQNDGMVTPELMYKMANVILPSFDDMLTWLRVDDD